MDNQTILQSLKARWLVFVICAVGAFAVWYVGTDLLDRLNASAYRAENEKLKQALGVQTAISEDALEEANRFRVEAELVKAANEKQAEIIDKSQDMETRLAGARLEEIQSDLEKDLNRIDATPDNEQFREMCRDAKAAGLVLQMCEGVN